MFRAYEPERDRLVAVKVFRLDLPPERVHQLVGEFERLIDVGLRHPAIAAPRRHRSRRRRRIPRAELLLRRLARYRDSRKRPAAAGRGAARGAPAGSSARFRRRATVEHGALHPRDVLLSSEGTRIVGLGITRALERIGAAVPIRRPYTAPERVEGAAWDHRADIFSLAAVVHEMLWARRVVGTGTGGGRRDDAAPWDASDGTADEFFPARLPSRPSTGLRRPPNLSSRSNAHVGAEEAAPEPLRLRVVEPQRVAPVAELLLPLEDDIALVEPELSEPELPEPELPEPCRRTRCFNCTSLIQFFRRRWNLRNPWNSWNFWTPGNLGNPGSREPSFRPAEPVKALEPTPVFLASTPAFSPSPPARSSSLVWPIGLACMVGVAIGFGVGYTVGIRDRASVSQAIGERAAAPAAPAAVAPPRDFTETHGRRPAPGCAEGWKRGPAPARGSASRALQRPRRRAVDAGWRTRVRRRPRSRVHACHRD